MVEWTLKPGDQILRKDLHSLYGGTPQGGIDPSTTTPNVLIFTDPAVGERFGYVDRWRADGVFEYTGEGRTGDQKFERGNKAILNHKSDGRALRLFSGSRGTVTYVGEFELDTPAYTEEQGAQENSGQLRKVIRFQLVPVQEKPAIEYSVDPQRYVAAEERQPVAQSRLFSRDPNLLDRALRVHKAIQDRLASVLGEYEVLAWVSQRSRPDYDLAWRWSGVLYVAEVKSLPADSESTQLRLGLGQVLDYQDQLLRQNEDVRAVLAVEREPTEKRWEDVCRRANVTLAWPSTFATLASQITLASPGKRRR